MGEPSQTNRLPYPEISEQRNVPNRAELKNAGEYIPELPNGEDAAAAGGRGPHAEEGAVGEAAPGGRRDVHIAAHLLQDLGPQRHQAPVLDRDPGAHRHLPPDAQRQLGIRGATGGLSRDGGELSLVRGPSPPLGTDPLPAFI